MYAALPDEAGERYRRLVGWAQVELRPGESKTVSVSIDPQTLSIYDGQKGRWVLLPGTYRVFAGKSSTDTPLEGMLHLH